MFDLVALCKLNWLPSHQQRAPPPTHTKRKIYTINLLLIHCQRARRRNEAVWAASWSFFNWKDKVQREAKTGRKHLLCGRSLLFPVVLEGGDKLDALSIWLNLDSFAAAVNRSSWVPSPPACTKKDRRAAQPLLPKNSLQILQLKQCLKSCE